MASHLANEFQSIKNKSTLWKFMMDNNLFDGIDNKYSNDVKIYFEKTIAQIGLNISSNDSLIILNKQLISEMMVNNSKYKQQTQQTQQALISASDITEHRKKVFNKVLEEKQSEFKHLINKNIPDKIDFSDNADKPIGSEMERMIAETISWREKQHNVILQSQQQSQSEAAKWINRDQTNDIKTVPTVKFLKIGDPTTLDNILALPTPNDKKVTFDLDNEQDTFLSMLHTNNTNNTNNEMESIKSLLTEVLNTQKLILDLLGNRI